MLRRLPTLVMLAGLILLAALIGSTFSRSGQLDVTTGLVQMCIVLAIYAFIGVTGVFSFGHVGFVAVGAYLSGLLAVPLTQKELLYPDLPGFLGTAELDPLLAVLAGGAAAALVGLLLAPSFGRLSGLSAALATFAMLVIVQVVARNYEDVTRGTKGLLGVPKETTLWGAATWAIVCLVVVFLFQGSRVGLQLRAAREDEVAARAMGIRVGVLRGLALVLSAFIAGVAGGVYGQSLGSFNPDVFYLDLTFLTLAMLVVGGVNSLSGAVIGTLILTFLAQWLRDIEASLDRPGLTEVCFALILILILALRPSGITGGKELSLPLPLSRWRRASAPAAPSGAAPADADPGARPGR
jgi:branched-chain amino acid transport system permease protein